MGWRFRFFRHEIKHFDALRVERARLPTFPEGPSPIAPAARSDINDFAAFGKKAAHLLHRTFVVELFFRFEFRGMVDIALGIDAKQIAAHAERNGEGIGDDSFAGYINDILGDSRDAFFREGWRSLGDRVPFGDWPREWHFRPFASAFRLVAAIIRPRTVGSGKIDQRADEFDGKSVVVDRLSNLLMIRRKRKRRSKLLFDQMQKEIELLADSLREVDAPPQARP